MPEAMINDISRLGTLPHPFPPVIELLRSKMHLFFTLTYSAVRTPLDLLPTKVSIDNLAAPAVLIGDAASAVPTEYSERQFNIAIQDGVMLAQLIRKRFDSADDEAFNRIPVDFYIERYPMWEVSSGTGCKRFRDVHGIVIADNEKLGDKWVRVRRHYSRMTEEVPNHLKGQLALALKDPNFHLRPDDLVL